MKKKSFNLRVYISGPLTDKETGKVSEENIAAFREAEKLLRDYDYTNIVNPTRVWACRFPWIYRLMELLFGNRNAYMLVFLYDLWLAQRCTTIYKIPGWRESRGSQVESCFAFHYGLWPLPEYYRHKIDRKLAKAMAKRTKSGKP